MFVGADDMAALHLEERELVDLVSTWTTASAAPTSFTVILFDVPRGNCATYFPEANPLVPLDSVADRSNTPTSKSVIAELRKR